MGIAIFLLSIVFAIVTWVFLAKHFKTKNKGLLLRHMVGFSTALFVFVSGVIIGTIVDPIPTPAAEQTEQTKTVSDVSKVATTETLQTNAPAIANNAVNAANTKEDPLLNVSLDNYIQQLNTTFHHAQSEYKVSKNLQITKGSVNDVATIMLSDNFGAILSLRKDTRELKSILVNWYPTPNQAENQAGLVAITAIASAVDGPDSMTAVGGKLLQKIHILMEKWSENQKEAHTDKFILNNIVYTINVNSTTGVMISISPAN